jgi:hypothetical protein
VSDNVKLKLNLHFLSILNRYKSFIDCAFVVALKTKYFFPAAKFVEWSAVFIGNLWGSMSGRRTMYFCLAMFFPLLIARVAYPDPNPH